MIAGMAMGSSLVAWHLAWSLDLCIPSSLNSQNELPGICCSRSVSGLCYPSNFSEPYVFSRNCCRSDCLLDHCANFRHDFVLKEDAMAFQRHHKSLEEHVEVLKTIDIEQQGSTTIPPEELHNAALQLSKARTLLNWAKARLEQPLS